MPSSMAASAERRSVARFKRKPGSASASSSCARYASTASSSTMSTSNSVCRPARDPGETTAAVSEVTLVSAFRPRWGSVADGSAVMSLLRTSKPRLVQPVAAMGARTPVNYDRSGARGAPDHGPPLLAANDYGVSTVSTVSTGSVVVTAAGGRQPRNPASTATTEPATATQGPACISMLVVSRYTSMPNRTTITIPSAPAARV